MNHRIVVTERGGPEVLELIEERLPEPGVGEVRVKVVAAGVSGFELLIRSVALPGNPKPPFTPSEDVAGLVDAIGEGVSGVEVGQMVAGWALGDQGGNAEYVCWPVSRSTAPHRPTTKTSCPRSARRQSTTAPRTSSSEFSSSQGKA